MCINLSFQQDAALMNEQSTSYPSTIFQGKSIIWILLTGVRFKCPITSAIQSTVLAN